MCRLPQWARDLSRKLSAASAVPLQVQLATAASLPNEILLAIMGYLILQHDSQTLYSLTLLCKHWNDAATDALYQRVTLRTQKSVDLLIRSIRTKGCVSGRIHHIRFAIAFNDSLFLLENLYQSYFQQPATEPSRWDWLRGVRSKAGRAAIENEFMTIISLCPSLSEVSIALDAGWFAPLIVSCLEDRPLEVMDRITSLVLCGKALVCNENICQLYNLLGNMRSVRVLSLCHIPLSFGGGFMRPHDIAPPRPLITELNLYECDRYVAESLIHCFASRGSLQRLHLAHPTKVGFEGSLLRLRRADAVTDLVFQSYTSLKSLSITFSTFLQLSPPLYAESLLHLSVLFDDIDLGLGLHVLRSQICKCVMPPGLLTLELRRYYWNKTPPAAGVINTVLGLARYFADECTLLSSVHVDWAVPETDVSLWRDFQSRLIEELEGSCTQCSARITTNLQPGTDLSCYQF